MYLTFFGFEDVVEPPLFTYILHDTSKLKKNQK